MISETEFFSDVGRKNRLYVILLYASGLDCVTYDATLRMYRKNSDVLTVAAFENFFEAWKFFVFSRYVYKYPLVMDINKPWELQVKVKLNLKGEWLLFKIKKGLPLIKS